MKTNAVSGDHGEAGRICGDGWYRWEVCTITAYASLVVETAVQLGQKILGCHFFLFLLVAGVQCCIK